MIEPNRPCPVCRTQLKKLPPTEDREQVVEVPNWYRYLCPNCGSQVWIQPFVDIKQVTKG